MLCLQVLVQMPAIRSLFQEHLVTQWEDGVMTSETLDRCLQTISAEELRQMAPETAQPAFNTTQAAAATAQTGTAVHDHEATCADVGDTGIPVALQ